MQPPCTAYGTAHLFVSNATALYRLRYRSYEILLSDIKFMAKYQWKYIVVDEVGGRRMPDPAEPAMLSPTGRGLDAVQRRLCGTKRSRLHSGNTGQCRVHAYQHHHQSCVFAVLKCIGMGEVDACWWCMRTTCVPLWRAHVPKKTSGAGATGPCARRSACPPAPPPPATHPPTPQGHRLKNMNCKLIRELRTLSAENKLLLTGAARGGGAQAQGGRPSAATLDAPGPLGGMAERMGVGSHAASLFHLAGTPLQSNLAGLQPQSLALPCL